MSLNRDRDRLQKYWAIDTLKKILNIISTIQNSKAPFVCSSYRKIHSVLWATQALQFMCCLEQKMGSKIRIFFGKWSLLSFLKHFSIHVIGLGSLGYQTGSATFFGNRLIANSMFCKSLAIIWYYCLLFVQK